MGYTLEQNRKFVRFYPLVLHVLTLFLSLTNHGSGCKHCDIGLRWVWPKCKQVHQRLNLDRSNQWTLETLWRRSRDWFPVRNPWTRSQGQSKHVGKRMEQNGWEMSELHSLLWRHTNLPENQNVARSWMIWESIWECWEFVKWLEVRETLIYRWGG